MSAHSEPAVVFSERPISTPSRGYDVDAKTGAQIPHRYGTKPVEYVMVVERVKRVEDQ
jgi:hypothetical protein